MKRLRDFLRVQRSRAARLAPELPLPGRSIHRLAGTVAGFALAAVASTALAVPTVDGWVFGVDGEDEDAVPDIEQYVLLQNDTTGGSRGKIYHYLDGATLYIALVASKTVNDTVCGIGDGGFDQTYQRTACWNNGKQLGTFNGIDYGELCAGFAGVSHSCDKLVGSDHAQFAIQCGSPNEPWDFHIDLADNPNLDDPDKGWFADHTGVDGQGTVPPGFISMSSFAKNLNDSSWDVTLGGDRTGNTEWKSPDAPQQQSSPAPGALEDDINDGGARVDGYDLLDDVSIAANFNAIFNWEWPIVYEFSFDTSTCDGPLTINPGTSHNSPAKSGGENIQFDEEPTLTDWGDAPDSYGTTADSAGGIGPSHVILFGSDNVLRIGERIDSEMDGQASADATGDNESGDDDEEGVHLPDAQGWTAGDTYSVTVDVTNTTGRPALVCGWIDFNDDGVFDDADTGPGLTNAERICASVATGTDGGTATLDFIIPEDFDNTGGDDGLYFSRFRITTDWTSSADASPHGPASDGEVEDHTITTDALPVSLNAFSSGFGAGGLEVSWQTASETNNVGFELWGRIGDEWRTLGEFIPSQGMNSDLPQSYEESVAGGSNIDALALVDYDTRGRTEGFGPFVPGESYGEVQPVEVIDWEGPRLQRQARLAARGFVDTGDGDEKPGRWRKLKQKGADKGPNAEQTETEETTISLTTQSLQADSVESESITLQAAEMTHVEVTERGIQRIGYEALGAGGLDLLGVRHKDIAVTWRGEPVSRWIEGQGGHFGPGHWIEFIGRPPEGDDALYIDANLYQVSVDPARAREAGSIGKGRAQNVSRSYQREEWVDRPVFYASQSPTGDPWVERAVLSRGSPASVTLNVPVEGPVVSGPASLIVVLGTITDLPDITGAGGEVIPEHNVEVFLKGPDGEEIQVATASTSGQRHWEIEAPLESGFVEPGTYQVRLRFDTDYRFSLIYVDRYGIRYASPYRGPALDFAPDSAADGYRIEGLTTASISAYGESEDGSLTRIDPRVERSGDGYSAELRQLDAARFWVDDGPHAPDVFTTEAPGDLLANAAGLVVISDSSFIGTQALEDYLQSKAAFNPVVVDVEDIYNSVGYGMALPGAIIDYLSAREEVRPYTHVQLVGTDCYDRLNYISQCISFIPLPSARVGVTFYSPSQNRLVDLDGDGVGDKAVGQFSVRDEVELETIVQKNADWQGHVAGLQSALLVAEEGDGKHDFLAQVERVKGRLDWSATDVLDMAEHDDINSAREAFRTSLDAGRTLTVFSGHSSFNQWAFPSLLSAGSAKTLTNAGQPSMMVPLACETTYDISPNANVLGHQLLYAGDRGALAISGAVSLASLSDNEQMANHIMDGLKSGLTLGEAVQAGRDALGSAFQTLQDNWVTQGDVTARLAP